MGACAQSGEMMIRYELFKWYKYGGKLLAFEENRHNRYYILELHPGNVYGVRKLRGKYVVVHKNSPTITFNLKKIEADRLIEHSKGWSGKVRKITVNAGKGGQDKEKKVPKDPGLRVLEIDSSNLLNCTYDIKHKTLYVEFRNGAVWAYEKVTPKEVDALEAAPSQGRYFIYMIRGPKPQYRVDAMPQSATNPPPKFGVLEDEDDTPHVTQVTMDHSGKLPKVNVVKPSPMAPAQVAATAYPEQPPEPKPVQPAQAKMPKTGNGKKKVKFVLGPKATQDWLGSEEASFEDHDEAPDHVYAILQRKQVTNETEFLKVLHSLETSTFINANRGAWKTAAKKLVAIGDEFPFTPSGAKAYAAAKALLAAQASIHSEPLWGK